MSVDTIFQKEQIVRTVDTWTFDESILSPIPDSAFGAMDLPKDVVEAFNAIGCWIRAKSIPTWNDKGKGHIKTGTEFVATMGRWGTAIDTITLRHGEKVAIAGYADIYKLED